MILSVKMVCGSWWVVGWGFNFLNCVFVFFWCIWDFLCGLFVGIVLVWFFIYYCFILLLYLVWVEL